MHLRRIKYPEQLNRLLRPVDGLDVESNSYVAASTYSGPRTEMRCGIDGAITGSSDGSS